MCCVINVGDAKIFVLTVIFSCGCVQAVIKRSRNAAQLTLFPRWSRSILITAWEQRKLGEVADRYDNLRIPITASERVPGSTPYYGANGIQDYVEGFTHQGEFVLIAEDGASDLDNYPTMCINGIIWVNNHAHVIQGRKGITDNHFIAWSIKRCDIKPMLTGGTRAKLNAEVLMGMRISTPNHAEQISIGSFFEHLDSLITLHQRKCEYRSLCGYLSWEQRKLGELLLFQNGFNGSSKSFGSGIPLISVMDVLDDEFITHETVRGKARLNCEEASRYCVEYGDVLFQRSSENQEDAGTSNVYLDQHVSSAFGGFVIRGKKVGEYNPIFIKYLLGSPFIREQITHRAQGAQHINVSQDTLADVVLLMPSMHEQEAAGLVFLHLDNLITLHQ